MSITEQDFNNLLKLINKRFDALELRIEQSSIQAAQLQQQLSNQVLAAARASTASIGLPDTPLLADSSSSAKSKRKFAIGDRVRILNPNKKKHQSELATVVGRTATGLIRIRLDSGEPETTTRKSKFLELFVEDQA